MLHTSLFYECNGNKHASPVIGILLPSPLQLQFYSFPLAGTTFQPRHTWALKRVMTTNISYQRETYKAIPEQGVSF